MLGDVRLQGNQNSMKSSVAVSIEGFSRKDQDADQDAAATLLMEGAVPVEAFNTIETGTCVPTMPIRASPGMISQPVNRNNHCSTHK